MRGRAALLVALVGLALVPAPTDGAPPLVELFRRRLAERRAALGAAAASDPIERMRERGSAGERGGAGERGSAGERGGAGERGRRTEAAPPIPPLARALVTKEMVREAVTLETPFRVQARRRAPAGTPWFSVRRGTRPLIVTAGHATCPLRDGRPRFPDAGTGSLALMLHRHAGVTVLFTTHAAPCDPNGDRDEPFKQALGRLVDEIRPVAVLDLHASDGFRPYDVDFGTRDGRSLWGRTDLLEALRRRLAAEGLQLSRGFFDARGEGTVTAFVSRRGTPCVQLEISSTRLWPGRDPLWGHRYAQLLQGLLRFAEGLGSLGERPRRHSNEDLPPPARH